MGKLDELERVEVRSRAQWRKWLSENHAAPDGIWLVTYKKSAGKFYVSYDDVVEEALCFGWIDGQAKSLDADRTVLLLSPRRPKSAWSKANKDRVARMIANKLMQHEGLEKIERAKIDGSWDFFNDIDGFVIPADLAAAFAGQPGSQKSFNALSHSVKRQYLYRLKCAKGETTRANWIAEILGRGALSKPS